MAKSGVPRSVPPGRDASGMRQRALELDLRAALGTSQDTSETGVASPVGGIETYRHLIVPLLQMERSDSTADPSDFFKPQDFADVARTFVDFIPYGEYQVVWCGDTDNAEDTNHLIPRYLDPADSTWKDWAGAAPTDFTDADTLNLPDTAGSGGAYTYRFWKSGWFPLPDTIKDSAFWIGINDNLIGNKVSYLLQIHLRGGTLVTTGGVTGGGYTGTIPNTFTLITVTGGVITGYT